MREKEPWQKSQSARRLSFSRDHPQGTIGQRIHDNIPHCAFGNVQVQNRLSDMYQTCNSLVICTNELVSTCNSLRVFFVPVFQGAAQGKSSGSWRSWTAALRLGRPRRDASTSLSSSSCQGKASRKSSDMRLGNKKWLPNGRFVYCNGFGK